MKNMNDNIRECSITPAQSTERGWQQTYVFPASFPGFQGHFPGNPILPAILQIMIARESIAEQTGRNMQLTSVTRAKFRKIVMPYTPVTAIWTLCEQTDAFIFKCTLETEGNLVSSFDLILTAKLD
jgi:3-hydroxymyristoyl/3-hydroxydecanoyl-(acyl carrier protein) dehydratase